MPVTRDMSAGERTLLYKFLDAVKSELELESIEAGPDGRSFAELSRSLRRG